MYTVVETKSGIVAKSKLDTGAGGKCGRTVKKVPQLQILNTTSNI
jgi:hypothetical protein